MRTYRATFAAVGTDENIVKLEERLQASSNTAAFNKIKKKFNNLYPEIGQDGWYGGVTECGTYQTIFRPNGRKHVQRTAYLTGDRHEDEILHSISMSDGENTTTFYDADDYVKKYRRKRKLERYRIFAEIRERCYYDLDTGNRDKDKSLFAAVFPKLSNENFKYVLTINDEKWRELSETRGDIFPIILTGISQITKHVKIVFHRDVFNRSVVKEFGVRFYFEDDVDAVRFRLTLPI